MIRNLRPLAAILLGLLVFSWGPCPGTVARMLRGEAPATDADRCGCGCCEHTPSPTPDAPEDRECPYCSTHGARPYGTPVEGRAEVVEGAQLVAMVVDAPAARSLEVAASDGPREAVCGPPLRDPLETVVLLN